MKRCAACGKKAEDLFLESVYGMVATPPTCCAKRATHYGFNDGTVLTMGCEWYVRQWCRDPWAAIKMARKLAGRRQRPASDE